ncbi:MAG: hypothetical protein PHV02_16885 [Rhodocyclaceae bacterium]|nr:hypothetical protein [Rhodocyclaceae bacterium]
MIFDLHCHELEVVKAFFSRGIAWAKAESAEESSRLAMIKQPDSETVEGVIFDPHGAHEFEQIMLRSVLNELNCLCEFAIQNTWIELSGHQMSLPDGNLVFSANRGDIEKAIKNKEKLGKRVMVLSSCPVWIEIQQIKEFSEGFKHRQRLQPFPAEFHTQQNQWRSKRLVNPDNKNWLAEYELTAADVARYIDAVDSLFSWLASKIRAKDLSTAIKETNQ